MSMRHRFATLCAAVSALALLAVPALASAAPVHNHGLTIATTENPIQSGDSIVIYGQLKGSNNVGKTIVLYHHINGSHQGFTVIQRAKTQAGGYYLFNRAEGVVTTNRQWFTRLSGDPAVHSRTVSEGVHALVSIDQSTVTGTTAHAVKFTGKVSPNHTGSRVALQVQGNGDNWNTVATKKVGAGSSYSISYRWRTPGARAVRVKLPTDLRNLSAESDTAQVTIQQTQNTSFTINTPNPTISFGSSDTVTGTLYAQGSSTTPAPATAVELCHGAVRGGAASCDQNSTTSNGGYTFTVTPNTNQWYYVKTVLGSRRTANLFIGVHDVNMASVSGPHQVGHFDQFTGNVSGGTNKAGEYVLLQRKGADGDFHDVSIGRVKADGTYSINWRYGTAGSKVFRTRILADGQNLGDVSNDVPVTVTLPATSSLTPAT
jgi:hypothetical protein